MVTVDDLVGESAPMVALRANLTRLLERVATLQRLPPILIRGETGTGKTMLARLIHRASALSKGPFVEINCAAFQETLLETQLFGRARHAYTEAGPGGPGLFQTAHRGVLFLDEIGDMSLALQAKVLTAIADRTIRRVGSNENEHVDVAIVAATNVDLEAAMRAKRFREDLYGRIAGITLEIPPLRAREGDVELLAERFLRRECERYGLPPRSLTAAARATLRAHVWRHNVRELELLIGKIVVMGDASPVTAEELGLSAVRDAGDPARQQLLDAWTRTNGNVSRTAEELGITRNAVKRRLDRWFPNLRGGAQSPTAAAPLPGDIILPAPDPAMTADEAPSIARPTVTAASHDPSMASSGLRWERRRVTVMGVVLRGESQISLAVTSRVLDTLVDRVRSFGGRVEELSPRGLVAVFGLEPDEDAPRRGANAALAIVKATASELSLGVRLHVARLLLATWAGSVILDEDGKREARRQLDELDEASGDGIALSEDAAAFLGRQFEIVSHAEHGRVAYRLVGRAPTDHGLASPIFVGRQAELSLLQDLFERTREGRGQIVSIVGDPGIGKSRLVHEFLQRLAPDAVAVLKGRCLSSGASAPYHLVLDVLRDVCGIQEADPPDAIEAKGRTILDRMGVRSAAWAPYVLNLLRPGQDPAVTAAAPELVRERTFEALQHLVIAQQERQPLVIVIEDLHWIDRTSEELIGAFAELVARLHILLVCTTRPGARPPWGGRSHASQIALAPLPADASRRLVEAVLRGRSVRAELVARILARADGNPFFLEELVRALRDEDDPALMRVPDTVHDVLSARILRLSVSDRRVLQSAAAIGRDIPFALLEAVCTPPPGGMQPCLSRLQAAEFLHPTRLGPDTTFMFNHTLTSDVAYDSMLEEDRIVLHRRIVEAIEHLYAARLAEHVERLAEHAERGEWWDRAITYTRQAATKAIGHSAYSDAAGLFTRALAALGHEPQNPTTLKQAIDLRLELRSALLPLGEFDRMLEILRDAQPLAERLGDPSRTARVSAYLTDYFRQIGDLGQAIAIGRRAREAAEQAGDLSLRVAAGIYLGHAYHDLGEYRSAADLLGTTLAAIEDKVSHERFGLPYLPAAHMRTWLSLCLAELGEFDGAVTAAQAAVRIAVETDHPVSMASAHVGLGRAYLRRGDLTRARPDLERAAAIARQWNVKILLPMILEAVGTADALSGRATDAVPLLEEALAIHASMRGSAGQSIRWSSLSTAYALAGRISDAMRAANQALDLADKHGERGHHAYALCALAGAALSSGDTAGAARRYREAVATATELEMRPLAARCHSALARLPAQSDDDVAAATRHLTIARQEFEAMGMPMS